MKNIKVIDFNHSDSSSTSYAVAWDGTTTPDVTKIPAGVTVTYQEEDYTGTLSPSVNTLNKIYLVGAEGSDDYSRYVTNVSNEEYSWLNIGNTEMSLAGYVQYETVVG